MNTTTDTYMSTESRDTSDFVSIELPSSQALPISDREVVRYDQFVRWLLKPQSETLEALHIGLGVTGEAGELGDAIKREYVYGKPRNLKNVVEELGDMEFYMQAARNHYGISRAQVLQANAEKLQERYVSLRYSDDAAIKRADKAPGE